MRSAMIIGLLVAAAPALALAQTTTEERRSQAYENIRQLEQTMRIDELARQVDNMEIRRRTDQNLQALATPQPAPQATDNPYTAQLYVRSAATRAEEDKARDAELAASNARLRALANQQRAAQGRP